MYAKEDPRYSYYILHMVPRDFYILLSNAIFFMLVPIRFLSSFNTLTATLVIHDRTHDFSCDATAVTDGRSAWTIYNCKNYMKIES